MSIRALLKSILPALLLAHGASHAASSLEFVKSMGLGWNLGNTMEACDTNHRHGSIREYETLWGNPETTRAMLAKIKASGFNSIRIPVAWSNLMGPNYTIHPGLMNRVQWIVDQAMAEGLIVVLNIHWDGGWWTAFPKDEAESMKRYRRVWDQVSGHFKGYPETLVFESLNEEGCFNDVWNRYNSKNPAEKQKAYGILYRINQAFVDLVRASGGVNAIRHLLIAGYATDVDLTCDAAFQMPKDPQNRLIVSVHYYTPYVFTGLEKDESWGKARRTWGTAADMAELEANFRKLKARFIDKGVPIIVGEYGAGGKTKDKDSIRLYMLTVAEKFYKAGLCPMLWDAGGSFNRRALKWDDPGLMEGYQKILAAKRTL